MLESLITFARILSDLKSCICHFHFTKSGSFTSVLKISIRFMQLYMMDYVYYPSTFFTFIVSNMVCINNLGGEIGKIF